MRDAVGCAAALILTTPAHAMAQAANRPAAPAITTTRYDEDWGVLADSSRRSDEWTDRLKYIPLDGGYLTTGLEARIRNESYWDNLWGSPPAPNDSYVWARLMPYADLHIGKVRAFVQPIAAYAASVAPRAGPVDQTRVDLLQGFADVELPVARNATLTLRGGRQMLSLGTERLIGTRYGPNVPLAFDGVRAILNAGKWRAGAFWLRPVTPGPDSFDDRTSNTRSLWGLYASGHGVDLYYLGYRNDMARFATVSGRELRQTLGVRLFGASAGWHWNIEGMAQFGHIADQRIRAWSVGSEIGRQWKDAPLAPDLTLRFNMVSGDTNAGDRTLGTFNALFPKGKYFGELSPIGPYNIVDLHGAATIELGRGVHAGLAAMRYWRYARADGIYDVPGNLLRAADGSQARLIGDEVEATISWEATRELELSGSLSAFRPGDFIRDTGPGRTIKLLGIEASFKF